MSIPGTSPYWGISTRTSGNPYVNGAMFTSGLVNADMDTKFRITPVAAAVPEPASPALFGLGLAAFGAMRRREKAQR